MFVVLHCGGEVVSPQVCMKCFPPGVLLVLMCYLTTVASQVLHSYVSSCTVIALIVTAFVFIVHEIVSIHVFHWSALLA